MIGYSIGIILTVLKWSVLTAIGFLVIAVLFSFVMSHELDFKSKSRDGFLTGASMALFYFVTVLVIFIPITFLVQMPKTVTIRNVNNVVVRKITHVSNVSTKNGQLSYHDKNGNSSVYVLGSDKTAQITSEPIK